MRDNYSSKIPKGLIPYSLPKNWTWFYWSDIMKSYQQGMIRSNRELGEGNVYYLKMGDIDNKGGVDTTNLAKTNATQKEIKEFSLAEGDFLINVRNSRELVGKTCVVRDVDDKAILYNHMLVRIDNGCYEMNYFINAFLNIPTSKKLLNRIKQGTTTVIALYQRDLYHLPIALPDNHTFNTIVNLYKSIDTKIELNNKINRELESMAKTLYDYWFVQFDFPDANGKPYKSSGGKMVYNAELKREIPEGWEVKKLGDIIKKYADKSTHIESKNILNEGSYPVITQDNGDLISGFTNENNPIEDVPLIVFGDHSCTLRYIDFPFFRGADGTQIMYFEEDLTIYVYLFLQMIITQIPGYGKYERHYKYLKEFNIIIPKAKFLSEFQKIVEPIFNKISKSRLQNQHLTTLRDWLLPMLMNGQVTVKEAQEKLSMAAEPSVKYGN